MLLFFFQTKYSWSASGLNLDLLPQFLDSAFLCVRKLFPAYSWLSSSSQNPNSEMCLLLLGHYLDQKRLKQGLYRHPWDDISYVLPEHMSM